jgi:hypothetical protein
MTQKEKHRLRDRAYDGMTPAQRDEAREAWARAWDSRRDGVLVKDVNRARLAMLGALADGQPITEAERLARYELARAA